MREDKADSFFEYERVNGFRQKVKMGNYWEGLKPPLSNYEGKGDWELGSRWDYLIKAGLGAWQSNIEEG